MALGNPVDVFKAPVLTREFCFSATTPDAIVESCASRLQPESTGVTKDLTKRLPEAALVNAPILVLGAQDDGMRIDGDALAVAKVYEAEFEIFPGMGHVMMLEPGWEGVAERIDAWLGAHGM
jgi:pimeloyl-ACP methyl ester carboxylesterase